MFTQRLVSTLVLTSAIAMANPSYAIDDTTVFLGVGPNPAFTSVSINGTNRNQAVVAAGANYTLDFDFARKPSGAIMQVLIGRADAATPEVCKFDQANYGYLAKHERVTLRAPTVPGTYYVGVRMSLNWSCAAQGLNWPGNVGPKPSAYLGAITVLGFKPN